MGLRGEPGRPGDAGKLGPMVRRTTLGTETNKSLCFHN